LPLRPEHAAPVPASRQLWPFAALSASYFAHIGFFNPYLPLWLKELGLGLVAISVLTSVQSATRLFAPYAWGWLSDRTGERVKLLRYGATAALVCSLGLWLKPGFGALLLVLLLLFMHTSSMMPMSEAAMAHLVSQGGAFDARRYGRVRLWGSLGFLVTVLAAGNWFELHGMRDFPAWAAATLAAVTLSVWWMPDLKESTHLGAAPTQGVWPLLRQPPVAWLFASIFFHVLSHIAIYTFFSLYLDSLGYSKAMIGLSWAVSVVLEIAWFLSQARWLPLMSLTAWLVLASALAVLRLGLTAGWAGVLVLLLLAQALHAITFATHHTVCVALISHHFPGRLRGRGQALYTVIGYGLSGILGGLGGGVLSARMGLSSVFWAASGFAAIGFACAWRVWRLQHPTPP
jgi:PPP family 3-phenylpropionic acid transporter